MRIATYVMDEHAKAGRVGTRVGAKGRVAKDCHNRRAWPGLEVVLDAIRRAGYETEYAGMATAHEYDIVLVSITSDCDWWPFVAEKIRWKKNPPTAAGGERNPIVIAGGAGVLNVRPFRSHCDAFVLGRGEHILPTLLAKIDNGERLSSPSVIWSDSFDIESRYQIAQVDELYPHEVMLTNGKQYREVSIGCPNKCFFCGYTWHRRYIGDGTFRASEASATGGSSTERTIIELLKTPDDAWQATGPLGMIGLDGMSERLRLKANKPITREMWREFLSRLARQPNPHQVKVYCIVGYPTETEDDWREFAEDLAAVDSRLTKTEKQWSVLLHCTPFRAMPATPAACWPMSLQNYRGRVASVLKSAKMPGNVFFQGNTFWAVEGLGTDSLSSVMKSAVCLRGTEADAKNIERVAVSRRFASASGKDKVATLMSLFDMEGLFGRWSMKTLPTRYLRCIR